MKKFILLPLLLCSTAFALPLGNPADSSLYCGGLFCCDESYEESCDSCGWFDKFSFRLGFYGDYVYNRHMQLEDRGEAVVDDFEIYTNAALVAVNFCNLVDLFATFGASNLHMTANPKDFGIFPSALLFMDTNSEFSWSVGGRTTIWDCDCFYVGVEGQYFYTTPNVRSVEVVDQVYVYPNNVEVKYTEWQVGVGAAYMLNVGCSGVSAIPYIGIKYAKSSADFNKDPGDQLRLFKLENQKDWGLALGFTALYSNAISVTAEGRWGDEKALHVNGQISF